MSGKRRTEQVAAALQRIAEAAFLAGEIDRQRRKRLEQLTKNQQLLAPLARQLFGPDGEARIALPDKPIVLRRDELRSRNGRKTYIIWFAPVEKPKHELKCLVGHRFEKSLLKSFRWNLRHLFEMYGVKEEYIGWDGAAEQVLNDLRKGIDEADFCLFDNRETTRPSKPNVYIEAGMAYALKRPFIFCHYKNEVWPSNFANVNYIPYNQERALFEELHTKLPLFLKTRLRNGL